MAYSTQNTMFYGGGTLASAADLSAKGGYGFKFSAGTAALADADNCDGVIVDGGTVSGDQVTCGFGECRVVTSAAVVAGALICCDANGKFLTAPSGKNPVGKALTKSAAAGDVITAFIYGAVDEEI